MKTTSTTTAATAAQTTPSEETTPIATLVPVLAILDSFNHRNKNQHRVARWWAAFDLLRRAVRRLHDALEAQARHRRALSFKSKSSSSSSKKSATAAGGNPTSSAERRQNALDEDVAARVQMLLESTIPSSFSAFTQLAADKQHAALGLVLLGLLARINSAVTLLAPTPAPAPREKATPAGNVTTTSSSSSATQSAAAAAVADERHHQQQPRQQSDSKGLGVAISRDQLKLAAKPSDQHPSSSRNIDEASPAIPQKKRKLANVPPLETKSSKPAKEQKPVKKKKKVKKTDDFSDLFSSLI
ncbi:hypothetical protein HER10_EVM0010903 [Colletotrichum scovillei]|uniref:Ribonuclease MRP protein subunit RMP1 n=1 Tax=Colletotrichum scovillei TaxID=1209932 RepID=A0A9P7RAQ1_9PEZI|nr:uncharacterized protein HER10_EVM0010903 [Colletotrichum scovillei]KAF4783512.1 hypothetical protein HER10_EVM0010903 [Colletotrichum scovillei]KAG7051509.1 ribonuclease MRP protein subunit RMP1 [Colletotrichum scovillei]KAG7070545.1 ribonuclease MRP protein subunit RMP1 [Colletotrichum scovillei]KAG7078796.1 ribonuclease MRP protein subunit RMP1 [Colletotrichum scovillei]